MSVTYAYTSWARNKHLNCDVKKQKIRLEKTWSFEDHLTKRLDRFEVCTSHLTKDLIVLKSERVVRWYERDKAKSKSDKEQWDKWIMRIRSENNEANEQCESDQKSKRMWNDKRQIIDQKIAVDELYWVKKIVFDDLRFLNDHHLAFIVHRWRGKSL